MKSASCFLSLWLVAAVVGCAAATKSAAQVQSFPDVRVRFVKPTSREMLEKDADLTIDMGARRIRVKSSDRPLDIGFEEVQKAVVELDTLGRKAGFAASIAGLIAGGLLFGNSVTTAIDKPFDGDHFLHLRHGKAGYGSTEYGLVIGRKSVPQALPALRTALGERLEIPVFTEKVEAMDKDKLPPVKDTYHSLNTDRVHPLPEVRPDKALVVVVTPATIMRRFGPEKAYGIAPLYANGTLVGVSGPGCYTFFHLDPGETLLVTQVHDAVGLRLNLQAGEAYYLTQALYAKGIRLQSFLTRHSPELVMYEVAGSLWSEWGPGPARK